MLVCWLRRLFISAGEGVRLSSALVPHFTGSSSLVMGRSSGCQSSRRAFPAALYSQELTSRELLLMPHHGVTLAFISRRPGWQIMHTGFPFAPLNVCAQADVGLS